MQYKIIDESPWQILSNAMTIGPSSTGYQLQVAADGRNYTTLFTVGAGITRQITNLSSGSYFRMKGNVGEVVVNWVRSCNDGGGGSGSGSTYTAGEYISIAEDVISVTGITPDLYLTSADTQDFATQAYVDAAITAGTQDFVTEADITAATTPIEERIDDVERVAASALTELHNDILDLSASTPDMSSYYTKQETDTQIADAIADIPQPDMSNYYTKDEIGTKEEVVSRALNDLHEDILDLSGATPDLSNYYTSAQTEDAISAATSGKADAANVTPNDFMRFPKWNAQGIITGTTGDNLATTGFYLNGIRRNLIKEQTSGDLGDLYAPITPGTAGQILVSAGSGAPVWTNDNKVSSTSVTTIWRGTQAEYDAITTPDASTLYIIVNN